MKRRDAVRGLLGGFAALFGLPSVAREPRTTFGIGSALQPLGGYGALPEARAQMLTSMGTRGEANAGDAVALVALPKSVPIWTGSDGRRFCFLDDGRGNLYKRYV